jgi:UDP-3-O-[3-hydroxymyristoyl] N-acetylglucosamine deacetylase
MLDLLGDLKLLGAPLIGFVEAHRAGHALHVELARAILANRGAWAWATEEPKVHGLPLFAPNLNAHPLPA